MNKSVWMDFVAGPPSVCELQTQNAEDVKLNQVELRESEDYTKIIITTVEQELLCFANSHMIIISAPVAHIDV